MPAFGPLLPSGRALALLLAFAAAACAPGGENEEATPDDVDAPLSARTLQDDAPADLPEEGKPDAVYPEKFDLTSVQSPVRSQGSRGVCSIFAAVALMEHLYKAEGSSGAKDFSEQYLQWSVKEQVKGFPDSEGSGAFHNLKAISDFGIVEETAWPYESQRWGVANDPACTSGDDGLPTRCYTNGAPPAAAVSATKWKLPPGRYLSSSTTTLKAHMASKKTAVVVGGTFFYQSWNHRRSALPVNSDYWRKGYVLSPNAGDVAESRKNPAGHEILVVGWDDTLSVQKVDKEGKLMVDASGRPMMETGFFLFKNSWGTGSFGVNNPKGDGYGWLSYKYVKDHLSAYVSDLPRLSTAREVCGDGIDNDRNGKTDCADSACSSTTSCSSGTGTTGTTEKSWSRTPRSSIPDNSATGTSSTVSISGETKPVKAIKVTLDITHTYRGDLTVTLEKDGVVAKVVEADGSDEANIKGSFNVAAFNGKAINGSWKLRVVDLARGDTGTLNGWTLTIAR
jgi:hypothetical protein